MVETRRQTSGSSIKHYRRPRNSPGCLRWRSRIFSRRVGAVLVLLERLRQRRRWGDPSDAINPLLPFFSVTSSNEPSRETITVEKPIVDGKRLNFFLDGSSPSKAYVISGEYRRVNICSSTPSVAGFG